MKAANILFVTWTAIIFSAGVALAGPCNTTNKDAGSGPTPGHMAQTTGAGTSNSGEHPPTSTMNKAVGDVPTSSQDAQRQMQGKPTAAQQAQGQKSADAGC